MKTILLFVCLSFLTAHADSETKELILNCHSAVIMAQELSKDPFTPSVWYLGDVVTEDAGYVDVPLADGVLGKALLRQIKVVANPLVSIESQTSTKKILFKVQGNPFIKNDLRQSDALFGYVELEQWHWHSISGFLAFRFLPHVKSENSIEVPCKLPKPWAAFLNEAASLRREHQRWFQPGVNDADVNGMRAEIATKNPLWRLSIIHRLIELKGLRTEDVKKALDISAARCLELGTVLVLLLNDISSHEDEIMEKVRTHGRDLETAEGLALGCLTSAAGRSKAIERAFESTKLIRELKTKPQAPIQDKYKMIDAVFHGNEDVEYRVAHKLNLMVDDTNKDLRQKIDAIFSLMLTP